MLSNTFMCVISRINIKIVPKEDSRKIEERLGVFNYAFLGSSRLDKKIIREKTGFS